MNYLDNFDPDDGRPITFHRLWRQAAECQCGYPDWPGHCPGPASCPCCQPDPPEDDDSATLAAAQEES